MSRRLAGLIGDIRMIVPSVWRRSWSDRPKMIIGGAMFALAAVAATVVLALKLGGAPL
jgi:hypothetical protein